MLFFQRSIHFGSPAPVSTTCQTDEVWESCTVSPICRVRIIMEDAMIATKVGNKCPLEQVHKWVVWVCDGHGDYRQFQLCKPQLPLVCGFDYGIYCRCWPDADAGGAKVEWTGHCAAKQACLQSGYRAQKVDSRSTAVWLVTNDTIVVANGGVTVAAFSSSGPQPPRTKRLAWDKQWLNCP
jgi:hypothetical protein